MTERVKFVLGNIDSRLAVVEIVGVRFPVLPQRPTDLVRLFAKEPVGDKVLGTGQRVVDGEVKNIAWWADAEEVARIDQEWRDAIEANTIPAELVAAMLMD
ncbi:hypothetical protein HOU95_gp064 [Streptomyces phage Hiyaa]|uniref:Uncharacterized protein n=1 Tax=Streptomyces phage Hiyaa TaxID=2499072 RepID=A0A3S9U919_9CAUD|nr:hypothetical protein HOU95_gp064 [Streptomyces phage Hiyaa]AZS06743.1 hypothetical protein SEA_HIYAA_104 [Streptomyces phage Hiyaa]